MNNNSRVKFTPPYSLNTAVLFLIFNRLDTTKQVFSAIKKAQPPRIYIAADGARKNKTGELEKIRAVRDFVMVNINWNCKVETLFRDENLGCKYAVSNAIDWFFKNEEMGIILEDDCLPSQSFFWFCEELLKRYKNDMRIMMVSGYTTTQKWNKDKSDYFFSNIGGIWGWATWKRAWQLYEVDTQKITTKYQQNFYLLNSLLGRRITKRRVSHFKALKDGLDTWDYQWSFARHFNSGLSCVPATSLTKNIGFGDDATHTKYNKDMVIESDIEFPLKINEIVIGDLNYDIKIHGKINYLLKLKYLIRRLINVFKK